MAQRRKAVDTRKALLDAARVAFTSNGFDQVGVREITGAVGVNVSLVNRYFGSKESLFAETLQVALGFDEMFDDKSVLSGLATFALDKTLDRGQFDPIVLMLRSAPVEKAQPILRQFLVEQAIRPLAARIGGDAAMERASLILGFLLGVIIMRGIIKCEPLASSQRNDLALLIEQIIAVAADGTA
jgi:AcrR family transcriptional regulator